LTGYRRHNELPVLDIRWTTVEAVYFNRVCVALRRRAAPPRIAIPGLKTLDLLLLDDAWVVVDRVFNDTRSSPGVTSTRTPATTCTNRCPARFASTTPMPA